MTLEASWATEIRDFLLGRLSTRMRTETLLKSQHTELRVPPVLRWWIFDGKQYPMLGGALSSHFGDVARALTRLHSTFNPRRILSDRLEGEIDWAHTFARGPRSGPFEYVVRSTGIGLDENERAALLGWAGWIRSEWTDYNYREQTGFTFQTIDIGAELEGPYPIERLRKWAHTARRSRWPLLRGVVAESLRPVIEPDELDRIPLPSNPAKLFELLCLVRIGRFFDPSPPNLRWLDAKTSRNEIHLGSVTCRYQEALARTAVLGAPDYLGSLARSVVAFDVSVPGVIDLVFDFNHRRNGFDGIVVEAKSGSQSYRDTVAQLRTYQGARHRVPGTRYILWGIVQSSDLSNAARERVAQVAANASASEDLWVFSCADDIAPVLSTLFPQGTA